MNNPMEGITQADIEVDHLIRRVDAIEKFLVERFPEICILNEKNFYKKDVEAQKERDKKLQQAKEKMDNNKDAAEYAKQILCKIAEMEREANS